MHAQLSLFRVPCGTALVVGLLASAVLSGAAPAQAEPFPHEWTTTTRDQAALAADLDRLTRDRSGGAGTEHVVWIWLTDKGVHSDADFLRALDRAQGSLTAASLDRRRVLGGDRLVDYLDVRIPDSYVEAIRSTGARVRVVSRWLSAVSVAATTADLEGVAALPFVARITPVARSHRPRAPEPATCPDGRRSSPPLDAPSRLEYGESYFQLDQIQVPAVHDLGYSGAGIIICMIDTGFYKDHFAFEAIRSSGRLLAEWDFINGDGNVQDEPGDPQYQHNHGTATWSATGGEFAGFLYGSAYGASFLLAKTEHIELEQPIEEDWMAAALEWADSLGAHVANTSCGYWDWLTYEDLDGDTAVSTIAGDIAAGRNMVFVNSAGNQGEEPWYYVTVPSDGDSVVSVGAVLDTGQIIPYSSHGPTYDGRTKPEVCAFGNGVYVANAWSPGTFTPAYGTSFSSPLVAGAAALLLEAHPEWTAMDVRFALMMTATNAATPDNHYGWGIPQVLDALNSQPTTDIELVPVPPAARDLRVRATPNPLATSATVATIELEIAGDRPRLVELLLFDVTGRARGLLRRGELAPGVHRFDWTPRDLAGRRLRPGVYFVQVRDGGERRAAGRIVVTR
jgi:subtilisin family serine protease